MFFYKLCKGANSTKTKNHAPQNVVLLANVGSPF